MVKKSSPPMMAKAKDQPRSNDGRKPGKNSGKSFFLVAQMIVPTMMKVAEEKKSNNQKGKKCQSCGLELDLNIKRNIYIYFLSCGLELYLNIKG